ncbi:hypothetical protein Tsubulata_033771 [Turnera subulata]|uniref:Uncharacterized protein n=1 Tax=Turnera subulata TaxID=218843 RepID=A0A9Q0JNF9_9ROSI|nr:hypothetical protein Tsubulata_033771 [Turnera subulata]
MSPSKTLEGVHGVHVVPHSQFRVEEITDQQGGFHQSSSQTRNRGNQQHQLVWKQRPRCLRPIHYCMNGDHHIAEIVANVATSLPFIYLELEAPRKNSSTKLYANSLIGVGVASGLYHSSRGRVRWLDYTMIATSCKPYVYREHFATSTILLPVQPMMVSAIHTGMMEVAFTKRASEDPQLRKAHTLHKMSSLLGGALFVADDVLPKTHYLHAGWHLAAAIGVGTFN